MFSNLNICTVLNIPKKFCKGNKINFQKCRKQKSNDINVVRNRKNNLFFISLFIAWNESNETFGVGTKFKANKTYEMN